MIQNFLTIIKKGGIAGWNDIRNYFFNIFLVNTLPSLKYEMVFFVYPFTLMSKE